MDVVSASAVLLAFCISIAGTIALCVAIERHNQKETRRELFGLSPGTDSWP